MASFRRAFFAYPSKPHDLKSTIESAATTASNRGSGLQVDVWPVLEPLGLTISRAVREKIDDSKFLVADVTERNFNVYYEIGYAIGKGLPVLPVLNRSFADAARNIQNDGFFDNLKYEAYQNTSELKGVLERYSGSSLLENYEASINYDQPIFVLDSLVKTDFRNSIVSAIKASKVFYRSFDPEETARFSTAKVLTEATSSLGAVIPFLAPHIEDSDRHNLRASFLAGIMHGLGRPALLVQHGENPVALDYREDVAVVKNADDARGLVAEFSVRALKSVQHIRRRSAQDDKSPLLRGLWLGSSAAENEFRTLEQYFLQTSEFIQTLNGTSKIVVGRKGSGKTAIFFMVRDALRRGKGATVVDLKPESHDLIKLRELLEGYVSAGVVAHTFAGFWFVLILIEILVALKKNYSAVIKSERVALEAVVKIEQALERFDIPEEGDFTSRLNAFVRNVVQDVQQEAKKSGGKITPERLTNFVFGFEQKALRDVIGQYTPKGGKIAVLFDNLDKGWPATGVRAEDVMFLRSLIEALNRIQRELSDKDCDFQFSVFLRNDVYELLVAQTTDRGKEAATGIDWSDREKLRLVVGKRISDSTGQETSTAANWAKYFPVMVEEKDGLEYAIDHSLMRPRFLIDIIERSIAYAINREHPKVSAIDLIDAVRQHSNYLVADFGYEIRDSSQMNNEIIDSFLGSEPVLSTISAKKRLSSVLDSDAAIEKAIYLLVWYGFFGIETRSGDKYIYDFDYSMRRMEAEIKRAGSQLKYKINPAFYVGLA